jgi:NAD(P)-dependent dehydrogenase (short-subunit alcohol dehydrogenase family)
MKHYIFVGGSRGIAKVAIQELLKLEPESHIHIYSREAPRFESSTTRKPWYWYPFDVVNDMAGPDLSAVDFKNFAGYVYAPGSLHLKPFTSLKLDEFRNDLEVNLLANVRFLQHLIPLAKQSELKPSFVFFSTVAAKKGMPMHTSIAAAKGAVEGLTRSLAAEYAPRMRFNCVAPSLTETDLAQALTSRENIKKASEEKHPLKRIGQSLDVAHSVVFLLRDTSSWMSGQILRPDGGMSL